MARPERHSIDGDRPKQMSMSVELITPEIAAEYLSHNIVNRRVRARNIKKISDDIKRGEWRTTHQGIAFDKLGRLCDGQQRLAAIIASGRAALVAVVRGVDPDAMDKADGGVPRDAQDRLTIKSSGAVSRVEARATVLLSRHLEVSEGECWDAYGEKVRKYARGLRGRLSDKHSPALAATAALIATEDKSDERVYEVIVAWALREVDLDLPNIKSPLLIEETGVELCRRIQ